MHNLQTRNRRGTQFHSKWRLIFVLSSHIDLIGDSNVKCLSIFVHILSMFGPLGTVPTCFIRNSCMNVLVYVCVYMYTCVHMYNIHIYRVLCIHMHHVYLFLYQEGGGYIHPCGTPIGPYRIAIGTFCSVGSFLHLLAQLVVCLT